MKGFMIPKGKKPSFLASKEGKTDDASAYEEPGEGDKAEKSDEGHGDMEVIKDFELAMGHGCGPDSTMVDRFKAFERVVARLARK